MNCHRDAELVEREGPVSCGRRYWSLAITAVALSLTLTAHAQNKPAPVPKPAAKPTATPNEDAQLYRNSTFGFRYQIPYSWVDRTKQMQEGTEAGKSELLLAVFERPPEAT